MVKVTLYSTQTCPWCRVAEQFLEQNKVKYEKKDVGADDEAAQEMIQKSQQMGVPVIDIDGKIVKGFDKEKIKRLLGI